MTYFQLDHARSLAAVADKLGESPGTVKNWSSKHGWAERLQTYQASLLQEQARQHDYRTINNSCGFHNPGIQYIFLSRTYHAPL